MNWKDLKDDINKILGDPMDRWKNLISDDCTRILLACIKYAAANDWGAITGALVIAVASGENLIQALTGSDIQSILTSGGGYNGPDNDVFDPHLVNILDYATSHSMERQIKLRVEHMIGAIVVMEGAPAEISMGAGAGLGKYVMAYNQLMGSTHDQKPRSTLNAVCVSVKSFPTPEYYIPRGIEEEILIQTRTRLVVLVGPSGVGKTTTIHHVINDRMEVDFYQLNVARIQLGARNRGDVEDRIYGIINELATSRGSLLIDDFRFAEDFPPFSNNSTMPIGSVLQFAFNKGVRVIMTADTRMWEACGVPSRLGQILRVINLPAMTKIEAENVIQKYIAKPISNESYTPANGGLSKHLVVMAKRYFPCTSLPGVAVGLLEDILSAKISRNAIQEITNEDVNERVAAMTRIPVGKIGRDEKAILLSLNKALADQIHGQGDAIQMVAKAVKRNRAGFGSEKRPAGSFLFLGPTGVGKTSLARVLADTIYDGKMLRIDMSEYSEKHSVARLIGSPPGYIGYNEGGQLINFLAKDPHCLVILDEVEKAHPNVWNIFLQVFEEGTITDGRGHIADCSHAIFVLTSNVGGSELQETETLGFRRAMDSEEFKKATEQKARGALKKLFPPEFLNRLDGTVVFQPLAEALFPIIAGTMMKKFQTEVPVKLQWTSAVEKVIAIKGYSKTDGARPMRRVIRDEIESPLVDMILEDPEVETIKIVVKNGEFRFEGNI